MKVYKFLFFLIMILSCNISRKINKNLETRIEGKSEFIQDSIDINPISREEPLDFKIAKSMETEEHDEKIENFPRQSLENKEIKKNSIKENTLKEPLKNSDVKMGNLIYHIPDTMIEKKTYMIRIRLNRSISDRDIKNGIQDKIVETTIKTTSRMEVEVIDPSPEDRKSFEIVKSNEDIQMVEDSGYTEWIYGVTPLKTGTLKLNIVISIIKGEDKKQIVYFDDIYVKSNHKENTKEFVSKYWQWFMSTIIIPFVVWFYNKRKKKGTTE
jgi:hypothetical protein